LIQDDFSLANLRQELNLLVSNTAYRNEIQSGYDLIRERIGDNQASNQAAQLILEAIGKK
jgi:lipid-A-disaccharide synthase